MAVSGRALDFAGHLSFETTPIGEASQMVRERGFFTGIEIGFEVEQGPSARKQQVQIGRIGDEAQRPHLCSEAEILGLDSAA